MKKILFVSALCGLSLFSCKKEQSTNTDSSAKPSKKTETTERTGHCAPWEDVADASAAAADLNDIVPCNTSTCSGTVLNTFYKYSLTVQNSAATGPYYFSLFAPTVTIATQNYLWGNALSQAASLTPTGYSISCVYNFRTAVVQVGWSSKTIMQFDVLYIKCDGGGGGGGN